ncbi:MAG: succinate dehydrogenase, hydrophobic membrane anchor protein [Gammaproteobacteria bacterium]|nr:succinate dehydrogenase, hydrophobic membrane anchor protein [Gammaproteobacteria bacterium]MDH3413183.1 succinate dehydrogenase, hydrophobic membrane anchor protein [Gammaproteobacteria bacterium]
MKKFRTLLNQVRGLGSAKEGTHHWWLQRLTAVALVPLSLWFAASLISMADADYFSVVEWMRSPMVTVLLLCLIWALFHHTQLGVQVVLEDYVHAEWLKITSIVALNFAVVVLGLACVIAVLKVSLGG